MKKYSIITLFAAFALFLASCEDTNENLVGSRGIAVVPVISDQTPESPVFSDLTANSSVSFTVDLQEGDAVDNAEIQIVYEGKSGTYKTIGTFPTSFTITAPEILSTLGITAADVSLGTSFYVYVITTSQGLTTRSQAAIEIKLPCEFDPSIAFGSYIVDSNWYAETGGKISIAADETDPYVVYVSGLEVVGGEGLVEDNGPLKMVINPSSFTVSVAHQMISSDAWGDGPIYYEGSGLYSSCDGNYQMTFVISIPGANYTTTRLFTLTRD